MWYDFDTKIVPLLKAAAIRLNVSKKILECATTLSNTIAGKKIPITVDFESFIDTWTFLGLPEGTQEQVLHKGPPPPLPVPPFLRPSLAHSPAPPSPPPLYSPLFILSHAYPLQVHSLHVVHLLAMFKKVCSHEIGLKAVQEQVNRCKITVVMPGKGSPKVDVDLKVRRSFFRSFFRNFFRSFSGSFFSGRFFF